MRPTRHFAQSSQPAGDAAGGASILNTAGRLPGQTGGGTADVSIILNLGQRRADKMATNRKQIKPRRDAAAENAARWREAFVRYLRSECHLAENTVLAYDRDLRRFFDMARRPADRRADDLRPGRLPGLAHRAGARAGEHQPARRVAQSFLPLLATRKRAERKPGRAAGHAETLAARADGALAG